MRLRWWWTFAVAVAASAQEDAASLSSSGVGEYIGAKARVGAFHPASMAWQGMGSIMVSTVPRVYDLPEVNRTGIVLSLAGNGEGLAGSFDLLRAGASSRRRFRVEAGLSIIEGVAVGAGVGLVQWSFQRYGTVMEGEWVIGPLVRSEAATSGLLISGIVQQGRPTGSGDLRIGAGAGVDVAEGVRFAAEVFEARGLHLRAAGWIALVPEVAVVVSWSEISGSTGGGMVIGWTPWEVHVGTQCHPLLGWTYAVDVRIEWR